MTDYVVLVTGATGDIGRGVVRKILDQTDYKVVITVTPGYKEKYGIKTTEVQPRFSHRSDPEKLVNDLVSFVTETNKCSLNEWKDGHQFRWIVIFGHYMGPLQFISRAMRKLKNVSFKEFYSSILEYAKNNNQK